MKQAPERAFKELLTKYPDAEVLWQANQDGRFIMCCRAYTTQGVVIGKGSRQYMSTAMHPDPIALLTTITSTAVNHYELKAVSLKDAARAI